MHAGPQAAQPLFLLHAWRLHLPRPPCTGPTLHGGQQHARRGRPPPGRWEGGKLFTEHAPPVHFWGGGRAPGRALINVWGVFATWLAAWELGEAVPRRRSRKDYEMAKKERKKKKKKLPCGLDVPTPRACPPPAPETLRALPRMLKDLSYPWMRVRCRLAAKMTGRRCRGWRRLQTNKKMAYAGCRARAHAHSSRHPPTPARPPRPPRSAGPPSAPPAPGWRPPRPPGPRSCRPARPRQALRRGPGRDHPGRLAAAAAVPRPKNAPCNAAPRPFRPG